MYLFYFYLFFIYAIFIILVLCSTKCSGAWDSAVKKMNKNSRPHGVYVLELGGVGWERQ